MLLRVACRASALSTKPLPAVQASAHLFTASCDKIEDNDPKITVTVNNFQLHRLEHGPSEVVQTSKSELFRLFKMMVTMRRRALHFIITCILIFYTFQLYGKAGCASSDCKGFASQTPDLPGVSQDRAGRRHAVQAEAHPWLSAPGRWPRGNPSWDGSRHHQAGLHHPVLQRPHHLYRQRRHGESLWCSTNQSHQNIVTVLLSACQPATAHHAQQISRLH